VKQLGIGPGSVNITRTSVSLLEKMTLDLLANPAYKTNARALGERIRGEKGLDNICEYIESYGEAEAGRRLDA
jgi:hypothetical protein